MDVEGDIIYDGMPILINLGLGMIENNPNAVSNTSNLSILEAHSKSNWNINNLRFVYDKNSVKEWKETLDILNKTHQDGIRKFNIIGEDK